MNKFYLSCNDRLGIASWTVYDQMQDIATFDNYFDAVTFLNFMNE